MRGWVVACVVSAAAIGVYGLARADFVRTLTGPAAYGDWRIDSPGLRRRITVADLPPPNATPPVSNPSRDAPRPPGVLPKAPFGFTVDVLAKDFKQPRVLRTAPNGDVFLAESGGGRVLVIRGVDKVDTPPDVSVFATGLERPYGIAFYPPGPEPKFVYVATPAVVYRYPYKPGDMVASGPGREDCRAARRRRALDTRSRGFRGWIDDLRLGRLAIQRRRRNETSRGARSVSQDACAGRRLGTGGGPGRRAGLQAGRQRLARVRDRPQKLLGARRAAADLGSLVRGQRARHARRRLAAGLRDHGRRRQVLRMAVVLHRRPRGPEARQGAAGPERPGDGSRRAAAAAFGAVGHRLLYVFAFSPRNFATGLS